MSVVDQGGTGIRKPNYRHQSHLIKCLDFGQTEQTRIFTSTSSLSLSSSYKNETINVPVSWG